MKAAFQAHLDEEFEAGKDYKPNKADWLDGRWKHIDRRSRRIRARQDRRPGRDLRRGRPRPDHRARGLPGAPHGRRLLDAKAKMFETGEGFDWATGEALAFGSLLTEGYRRPAVRAGQTRGTFSQRHSALVSQETRTATTRSTTSATDSAITRSSTAMLSEYAVLGFEYGYSAGRAQRADHVGGAVRRLRQRRADHVRPVHLVGRVASGCGCPASSACCRTATRGRGRSIPAPGWSGSCRCAARTTGSSPTARRRPTTSTSCAASCTAPSASRWS